MNGDDNDWLDGFLASVSKAPALLSEIGAEAYNSDDDSVEEDITEELRSPLVDLDALVVAFVETYTGMKQRDASWHAAMGVTVGGSELAALMGLNPYSTFYDVVHSKLATLDGGSDWDGGSEACWWGVLFEDVIGAYTALDVGGAVRGDEICIQVVSGHRNSPDGYVVAWLYRCFDGRLRLWTTDMAATAAAPRLVKVILLLEFKCPLTRKPKGNIPPQYQPQVWSGLAVSPIAHKGLFVDAVFRKCGLLDLGDTPDYDTAYHGRDGGAWEHPVAWGFFLVLAPRLDAPRHVRLGWRGEVWAPGDPLSEEPDADAAQAAWQIHSTYFGLRLRAQGLTPDLADLGDMEARQFNRALGLINRGRFPTRATSICFADGRGQDLHSGRAIGAAIAALRRDLPAHYWPLGVFSWKLFEVDYVLLDRRPGFLDEVLPLIEEVHQTVIDARASPDPAAFLSEKAGRGRAAQAGRSAAVGEDNIQDLFDSITPSPSPGADAQSGADSPLAQES
jgi:hypothetical protein